MEFDTFLLEAKKSDTFDPNFDPKLFVKLTANTASPRFVNEA